MKPKRFYVTPVGMFETNPQGTMGAYLSEETNRILADKDAQIAELKQSLEDSMCRVEKLMEAR